MRISDWSSDVCSSDLFVVDHRDELDKVIAEVGAQGLTIMVRVNTPPADDTLYHLAAKFGAAPDDAAALMQEASRQGCAVGLAFHEIGRASCRERVGQYG